MLGLRPQTLGIFRLALGEHLESGLLLQKVLHFASGRARIDHEWVLSHQCSFWIIAIQQPLAGVDCKLLVGHRRRHIDTVGDAVRIGDDEAGAIVGFRFQKCLERVFVLRAHGHAGDIDVAIAHGH